MHYSITFGSGNDTRNTWTDWKLVPESPPVIPTPDPKTNFVDIPGRAKGALDMSTVPFGCQVYERMTGSWTFVMYDDYWNTPNRVAVFEQIRGWLHGKRTRIMLEEDQQHLFYGIFTVTPPQSGIGPFVVEINYDLEPVRYNLNGEADTTWLPDVSSWSGSGITPPVVPGTIEPITDEEIEALFEED